MHRFKDSVAVVVFFRARPTRLDLPLEPLLRGRPLLRIRSGGDIISCDGSSRDFRDPRRFDIVSGSRCEERSTTGSRGGRKVERAMELQCAPGKTRIGWIGTGEMGKSMS